MQRWTEIGYGQHLHLIVTNQLIFSEHQLTGFYMMRAYLKSVE